MATRTVKPNTGARRNMSFADFSKLTRKKPEKSLLISKKQKLVVTTQGR